VASSEAGPDDEPLHEMSGAFHLIRDRFNVFFYTVILPLATIGNGLAIYSMAGIAGLVVWVPICVLIVYLAIFATTEGASRVRIYRDRVTQEYSGKWVTTIPLDGDTIIDLGLDPSIEVEGSTERYLGPGPVDIGHEVFMKRVRGIYLYDHDGHSINLDTDRGWDVERLYGFWSAIRVLVPEKGVCSGRHMVYLVEALGTEEHR